MKRQEKNRRKIKVFANLRLSIFLTNLEEIMNRIKMSFLIAMLASFISLSAQENQYIFIGQTTNGEVPKTAFVLDLVDGDLTEHFKITENGELYLKVDKIFVVSKDQYGQISTPFSNHPQSFLTLNTQNNDRPYIRCSNCRHTYEPRPPTWSCPRCGTYNGN
jgi:rubrerythrin